MKNTGVRALSRKLGVSAQLVSYKRQRGKSDAVISAEAKQRKAKLSAILRGDAIPSSTVVKRKLPVPASDESKAQAETRKEVALANLREIEEQKKRGELLELSEVESTWLSISAQFKNALLGISARVINRIPVEYRREVLPVLDSELAQALTSISDDIRHVKPNRKAA
jgi:phage terminase Nu1 subunit (DNA packaging protein)